MSRTFYSACLFLAIGPSLALAQPKFNFFEPVNPPRALQVMVHRGMATAAPENSDAAIKMCIDDYCEWVEIDVRLSKDGKHVIIESETVDSTTNGKGKVADLTLDELKKLDAGSWFAQRFAGKQLLTLREALEIAKGKINLNLDCKRIDPKLLVEEIAAAEMQQQVAISGTPDLLSQVRSASNGKLALVAAYDSAKDLATFVKDTSPAIASIDADAVTSDLCNRFHGVGIKVVAKAVGEKRDTLEVWNRIISAGADFVETDNPAGVLYLAARQRIKKFPVMVALHRGASRYAPENTIPAIREAAIIGADFAEIDIRTTKDGKTVLMHDNTINRTTAEKGPVRDHSYDELTSLSAGTWFGKPFRESRVPSFDEGLTEYGKKMGGYLDSKDIAPEALIAAIHKYELEDRHVVYQSLGYCEKLRQLDPKVRTMPPLRNMEGIPAVAKSQAYAVDAAWRALSKELIAECHKHNIKVFSDALGPNETVERYREAIHWGIDCIQTDHPLKVLRAIELESQPGEHR